MDSESPEFTPLFDQQLLAEGDEVEGDEEEDEETLARLLREELDDEEDVQMLTVAALTRAIHGDDLKDDRGRSQGCQLSYKHLSCAQEIYHHH